MSMGRADTLARCTVYNARPIADVSRPTVTDPIQTTGDSLSIYYIKGTRLVEKERCSPSFPSKKLIVNGLPKTDNKSCPQTLI